MQTKPQLVETEQEKSVLQPYAAWGKRLLDITISTVLLLLLSPIFLAVVVLVRFSSIGAPALFKQTRVGLHGKSFTLLKFRTMDSDRREHYLSSDGFNGDERRFTHKTDTDPRHTRLGKFLRKTSIDELPQLINVIKGEMSLVGPRPEILEVAKAQNLIDHQRHHVRPGITGLWQVSPLRAESLYKNVHIDLEYVKNISMAGDFKIILRTVKCIVCREGA